MVIYKVSARLALKMDRVLEKLPVIAFALFCLVGLYAVHSTAHYLSDPDISTFEVWQKRLQNRIRHKNGNKRGIRHSLSRPVRNKQ